jgi:glycosyltransferase involved in cell wall biosynthesis
MKKLLIINQYASTPQYSTGAGERFYSLLPYFNKAGYEVNVISGSYNHLFLHQPPSDKLFNFEDVPGGNFIWVKLRKYKAENFVGRLFSWIEFLFKLYLYPIEKTNSPHIVLVSSMSIFPILYAFSLKKKFATKIIFEVRDIWPYTPVDLGGFSHRHPFILLLGYLEKLGYKKADLMVSVLPGLRNHLKNVLGYERETVWIPNGIDLNVSKRDIEKEIKDSPFTIMYTGALGIANAMEYIIEAAMLLKENKDIQFRIIGEGPEKIKLKAYLIKENMENVIIEDKVPKAIVYNILMEADLCIISWRNKNIYKFGVSANKYNDYMLAAKPILSASNIDDDPVIMAKCGLQVEPESPQAIANGILKLKEMTQESRREMGKNGLVYVTENRSYAKIAQQYIAEFKKLNIGV